MLGVDRQQPRPGRLGQRHHQLAAEDEALLVGESDVGPLGEGDDRRSEPRRADDRVENEIRTRGDDQLLQTLLARENLPAPALPRPVGRLGVVQRNRRHPVLACLLDHRLPGRASRQADRLQLSRAPDHLQRLRSDGPGRAEYEDLLHA